MENIWRKKFHKLTCCHSWILQQYHIRIQSPVAIRLQTPKTGPVLNSIFHRVYLKADICSTSRPFIWMGMHSQLLAISFCFLRSTVSSLLFFVFKVRLLFLHQGAMLRPCELSHVAPVWAKHHYVTCRLDDGVRKWTGNLTDWDELAWNSSLHVKREMGMQKSQSYECSLEGRIEDHERELMNSELTYVVAVLRWQHPLCSCCCVID